MPFYFISFTKDANPVRGGGALGGARDPFPYLDML